jgi:hypothetical protein
LEHVYYSLFLLSLNLFNIDFMKKLIIGISTVLIAAFVILLTVNGQSNPQDTKKSTTETASKDCQKGQTSGSCCKMKYGTTADTKSCDKSDCKEKGCDKSSCKEGKCTHEGCKSAGTTAAEGTKCSHQCPKSGSMN